MKVLALLRHAKAVKDDTGGDHARALSKAGRSAAAVAGKQLRPLLPPDVLVVASDARRTQETAELAFPGAPSVRIRLEPSLYNAQPTALLAVVRNLPADVSAAVVVGHNPGISELGSMLAGAGDPADVARAAQGLATADAVVIEFPGDWTEIGANKTGRIAAMLERKDFDG